MRVTVLCKAVRERGVLLLVDARQTDGIWCEIRLGIDNPESLAQFERGKSYHIEFTPAVEDHG